ncbi:hypothetical protein RIF29_26998 [Crotalaria pallida]|uniref:Amino acid transporter transmembrane domain-containing protein n=1 Tax=Crotalaria pallida TaxID=3830 RepID=A0AAN9I040_CROPI
MVPGNALTASAHIITTVIGAGVLALPWALAQLGWIPGIAIMLSFSAISLFTYNLVADCYRFPDPLTGKRNYTYNQAVKAYLSTKAVCFHRRGHEAFCEFSYNPFMIGFGILQVFLSQISNFHELTWLSTIAAITSFGYTFIASGLSLSVIVSGSKPTGWIKYCWPWASPQVPGKGNGTSITGIEVGPELCAEEQVWRVFTAMGNIALASNYATVAFDIMDTLKSYPPENIQMKKANVIGITAMTILFLLCSCLGYTAFGDKTSGNIFGAFYEPFWLVSLGNVCILIHMVGAYQVVGQSFFRIVEMVANTAYLEDDVCDSGHNSCHGNAILRRNSIPAWGSWLLAYRCFLPYTNAHCPEKDNKIIIEVVFAPTFKLLVLPYFTECHSWFNSWN